MTLTVAQEQSNIYVNATLYNDQPAIPAGAPVNAGLPNGFRAARIAMEDRQAYANVDRRDSDAVTRAMLRTLAGIPTTSLSILALGDSITAGHNSADGTGYCGYLTDLLDRRNIAASIDRTGAIDGTQLGPLAAAVPAVLAANPGAQIVLLMVGTNDASPTVANWPPVSWQGQYLALVDLILASSPTIKVACGRTVLADPYAASYTPTFHANQLLINSYVENVVEARLGGRVVKADMSTIPSSWLTDGGWHPGDAAYLRMAKTWVDAIGGWL